MEISSPHCTNTKIFKASGRRRRQKSSGDLPSASRSAKRSSIYRGVTRHKLTGRYEAHIWDKTYLNKSQNKKGRQGAYDTEETAARNYDLAALKYWGTDTTLNFPVANYDDDYKEMQGMSKEDYLASLRRRSSGFSRGASKHHYNGRWEARIGRINGNKYLYLGTFNNEEEAAQAYDRAALVYRGSRAVTNFDINQYTEVRTQSSEPLPPPSQHQNFAHPITLSSPTYSFGGTMAMVDDNNELLWSSRIGSSYETFSISDLFFDINVSDDHVGGLINDIGELIDDIERLFDESCADHFSVNGEGIEKSMAAISSGSDEIMSTSLIGGQHLVEKEMSC
ncbi:hypothetical protein IEQ34_002210 [Dendrobium chrysotoxum]|uniref:AP2/ERF domain-containing protein n=1 Tax=Dendrobium chrysotoxum TaxID=161865 RepID=A0AAV7HN98_DENCH|nr:hypothetical protein IEQ34_002210 [Dendrobium chrysotoxum]